MTTKTLLKPEEIRAARSEDSGLRSRDFAEKHGLSEAELTAAYVGQGVTRIAADLDRLFPRIIELGEVMALTRNRSCVIEKVGLYEGYKSGAHAAMVLADEIDMRMFPGHFVHGFAVVEETDKGVKRSIQVFDAAGDAVHKIHLRPESNVEAFDSLVADLATVDQSQTLDVTDRRAPEGARINADKVDALHAEWDKMTDTHQFMRLTSKLKMNRLGAYRVAGAPRARQLGTGEVDRMLNLVQQRAIEVMIFVGNKGCIEIHGGPIGTLKAMGPWQNVMDPRFNLHLRLDHIAEVWAVDKPTQRGPAISVEAFDAEGELILQVFGRRNKGKDYRPEWDHLVSELASLPEMECV